MPFFAINIIQRVEKNGMLLVIKRLLEKHVGGLNEQDE